MFKQQIHLVESKFESMCRIRTQVRDYTDFSANSDNFQLKEYELMLWSAGQSAGEVGTTVVTWVCQVSSPRDS